MARPTSANGAETPPVPEGVKLAQGMARFLLGEDGPPASPGDETASPPYRHLVRRAHPWRQQLYVKGRNLTVRQLVGTIQANALTEDQAARDLDLPVEAIREALAYYAENVELIDLEAAWERYVLAQRRKARAPLAVP